MQSLVHLFSTCAQTRHFYVIDGSPMHLTNPLPNVVYEWPLRKEHNGITHKYIALVTELMTSGTLKEYLKHFKKIKPG